jgi:NADPH-dependent glutamate synthase beta subunit-like oxidoreductase
MYDTFNRVEVGNLPNLPALYRAEQCATCEGPKPCTIACPVGVDVERLVRRVAEAVRLGLAPVEWFATEADRAEAYVEDCMWASYNIS